MVMIHYNTAYKALDNFIKCYNDRQTKLSSKVRQSVASTARELIRIYGPCLIKANGLGPVDKDNLPSLRTNNVQLARLNNCSTRTVHRHINKLLEAGILVKKIWHGTNSSYEVWINPEILSVTEQVSPSQAKNKPSEPGSEDLENVENDHFKPVESTKCPHTDAGNNRYFNIIIGVDNLENKYWYPGPCRIWDLAGNKAGYTKKRRELSLTALKKAGNTLAGNTQGKVAKKNEKFRADFSENGCKTTQEAQGKGGTNGAGASKTVPQIPESESRSASLSFYVQMLWTLAKNVLYRDVYLTERQESTALQLIMKWYEPVSDGALSRIHDMYVQRIDLAFKYVDKDPENRYVQLPNRYFDPLNPSGFTGTKKWWKAGEKRKKELREKLILNAQIRRFLNNQKKPSADRKPPIDMYRECEQRISQLANPLLLELFYAAVLTPETKDHLYPN